MYKSYFFLERETTSDALRNSDPFRYKGAEAAAKLESLVGTAAGYTQTRTLKDQIADRGEIPFCGIAELSFTDARSALESNTHAEAIQSLLEGPGEMARMGRRSREIAESEFNEERMLDELELLLRS